SRSYFDDDFSGSVSAPAGEHFVRSNRVGQRKNATHGYRQFASFVQLCKLRQLVRIYVDNEIVRSNPLLRGKLHIRSNDGGTKDLGANSEPIRIWTKFFDDA